MNGRYSLHYSGIISKTAFQKVNLCCKKGRSQVAEPAAHNLLLIYIRKEKRKKTRSERERGRIRSLPPCGDVSLRAPLLDSLYLLTVFSSRAIILFPILRKEEENNPSSPGSPNVVYYCRRVISLRETHKLPKELPTTPE